MINALPEAEDVTVADKVDIEAARAAYDNLTDEQKALVDEDTYNKLTDAETALAKAEEDAAAAKAVEHAAVNRRVVGSCPTRGAKRILTINSWC